MPEPTWGQSNKRSRRSCRTVGVTPESRPSSSFSHHYACIRTAHSFLHLLDMKGRSTVKRHVHEYMSMSENRHHYLLLLMSYKRSE
jgi:hypothetical protein